MVEPEAWPSMVAEAKTLIRERLTGYEEPLQISDVLDEMMRRRNHERFIGQPNEARRTYGDEYVLLSGEVAWVVGEAIRELEAEAEIRPLSGGIFESVRLMAGELGFESMNHDYRPPSLIAATPKRVRLSGHVETTGIRWDAVRILVDEARRAHLHGLEVLSSVGARVATEEAIRSALFEFNVAEDEQARMGPWRREEVLFDEHLPNASVFTPMDKSSTKAALSGIRNHGNDAAHTGTANDAHLNELFVSILPRALQSLSAAVDSHV